MSPLEHLKNVALAPDIPFAINKYKGKENIFCVYRISGVSGTAYADNRAQEHIAAAEFHYVQPIDKSYTEILFRIIDLMAAEGFTEPDVVIVNDSDKYTILQFFAEIRI